MCSASGVNLEFENYNNLHDHKSIDLNKIIELTVKNILNKMK